jgi:thymidylate kinase
MPGPLIAVVGVCASGKTTLAQALRARGWNARQVLQEHSYVPDMWQRITGPDLLIYLDASLETIRFRRHDPEFPDWILEQETHRLRHARRYCDLYLLTDALSPEEVLEAVLDALPAR